MYTVTRQLYYYSGEAIVEIASGGIDYSGSDALSPKYPGEMQEYSDPREAVEVAIRICNLWRKEKPTKYPRVGHGSTLGMGLEIEASTYKDARAWAAKAWEALEKCTNCGNPMPDNKREFWRANDYDGIDYCSEHCADMAIEFDAREEARYQEELEAELMGDMVSDSD